MSKVLLCKGDLTFQSNVPICTDWEVITADVIVTPAESAPIDPSTFMLAFGSGFTITIPLLLILWKIKVAKEALQKS